MRPITRNISIVFGALSMLVGVPAAAYAAEKRIDFHIDNGDFGIGVRLPNNPDNDFYMPARANGEFLSNVFDCPSNGPAAYNIELWRDRSFSPDDLIRRYSQRFYCADQLSLTPAWDDGHFHFNAGAYYYPQPSGNGYAGTRW